MTTGWMEQLSTASRIGFDTNALIYFLERRPRYYRYVAEAIDMMESRNVIGVVSAVVEMELLVKPIRERDVTGMERIGTFLGQQENFLVRSVDRIIARRAANVRALARLSPLDAIIIATCLEEGCDAIIGNDSELARKAIGIPYIYLNDYVL